MKKMMMIAAMMVATLSANAQNEVGQFSLKPTVGLNIANITKFANSKVRPGLNIGLEAEYGVTEKFGVTAGFFYSQQGVKINNIELGLDWFDDNTDELVGGWAYEGKATYKLDYINIPIMAQYYLIPGLAVKAGIQPGFNALKKIGLDGTLYQGGVLGQNMRSVDESYKIGKNDGIKSFQFAIPVGLSYEYKNFVLDARYNIYLTKAFKEGDGRHSVFSITLGYKIPLN